MISYKPLTYISGSQYLAPQLQTSINLFSSNSSPLSSPFVLSYGDLNLGCSTEDTCFIECSFEVRRQRRVQPDEEDHPPHDTHDTLCNTFAHLGRGWWRGQLWGLEDWLEEDESRIQKASVSVESRPLTMAYNTSGWTLATSASQVAPSFRRLLPLCSAGITMRQNATYIWKMFWQTIKSISLYSRGRQLYKIMGISVSALQSTPLSEFSFDERTVWAKTTQATQATLE